MNEAIIAPETLAERKERLNSAWLFAVIGGVLLLFFFYIAILISEKYRRTFAWNELKRAVETQEWSGIEKKIEHSMTASGIAYFITLPIDIIREGDLNRSVEDFRAVDRLAKLASSVDNLDFLSIQKSITNTLPNIYTIVGDRTSVNVPTFNHKTGKTIESNLTSDYSDTERIDLILKQIDPILNKAALEEKAIKDRIKDAENLRERQKKLRDDYFPIYREMLTLFGLQSSYRSDIELEFYSGGILKDLPAHPSIPDNLTDLVELGDILNKLGAVVATAKSANPHEEFIAALDNLKRKSSALVSQLKKIEGRLQNLDTPIEETIAKHKEQKSLILAKLKELILLASKP
ncbi:MAG TPA: hypothetical protein PKD37_01210 [Oligoflexia bacterium]|nr:hypothetical protein [Oligoflexia bacterium]HMP26594.1 hypothetical protein [Oligoflexia bacterium]